MSQLACLLRCQLCGLLAAPQTSQLELLLEAQQHQGAATVLVSVHLTHA